jgi:glycosyltransferase involved in cell wall biosynthesis
MEASNDKMKKVLVVAYAFPPFRPVGHSIRVVKFVKYLPALGWLPVVLTIDDRKEYRNTQKVGSESLLQDIQPQVKICRTSAGEPSLQLVEKGRELGRRNWLTQSAMKIASAIRRWAARNNYLPNLSWLPFAVRQGRQIAKAEGIDVIFVTCPPHSVTLVGAVLKLFTGKPLVLDFRDDWIDTPWHRSMPASVRRIERWLERWVVGTADKVVLVTEWSRNAFQARYPKQPGEKFVFIPNGCDLEDFAALDPAGAASRDSKFTILHAGSLNDSKNWKRSSTTFFQAVRRLLEQQPALAAKLCLAFAGDFPVGHRRLAEEMGLSGLIKEWGHVPHGEVLRLIQAADLLLAMNFEGGFATLIPGKIYEYWAVGGPPILLLSCPGAASALVEKYELGIAVDPDDIEQIGQAILDTYQRYEAGNPGG